MWARMIWMWVRVTRASCLVMPAQTKIDYEKVVRGVVAKIGFDSYVDDLSSVDSKGLSDKTCEVLVRINKQSPDIAGGVHVGKDDLDVLARLSGDVASESL